MSPSSLPLTHLILFVLSLIMPIISANPLPGTESLTNPTSNLDLWIGLEILPATTTDEGPTPTVTTSTSATPALNLTERAVAETEGNELQARGAIARRSFMGSCGTYFILIDQRYFSAYCKKSNGVWVTTPQLDLNKCIANINGFLQWGANGNFKSSCIGASLHLVWYDVEWIGEVHLVGNCLGVGGVPTITTLNLDGRIHNFNGVLGCG